MWPPINCTVHEFDEFDVFFFIREEEFGMFGKAAVLAPFVFWRTSLCPKKTLEPPCIIAGFFWDLQHHQFQLVMEQVLRPWPRYPQRSRWYCDAWKPGWLRWQGLIQIGWIFVYAYASCVYLQYVYGVYSIRKICFAVAAFQNVLYKISWSIYTSSIQSNIK